MVSGRGIVEQVGTAWQDHWPYFKVAVVIFVMGLVLGILLADQVDLVTILGFDEFEEVLPPEITVGVILLNNTLVFLLALLGAFSLGSLTVLILVFNGALVGFVAVPTVREAGIEFLLVAIVPHGLLELPAFFVAAAVTFRLLHRFYERVRDRRDRLLERGDGWRIVALLAIAWGGLALAAAIEVHVTLRLVEALFPDLAAPEAVG